MSDWEIPAVLVGLFLLIALLIGAGIWSGQDFANRCERAGGVNIDYQVCVPAGTDILMVN